MNGTNINFALFNLGFRPFFLGASIYSIIIVLLWMVVYAFNFSLPMSGLSSFQWHAHEMIYGYAMAVIAGFLLTAVKNWTGIQTVHGAPLVFIFLFWLIARVLFLFGSTYIKLAAIFDLLFLLLIIIATAIPIIKTKNWKQLVIISKLLLLAVANISFYLGYTGELEQGIYWSIYGGLYLLIGLILTISSRVMPFFIERGVDYPLKLPNPRWIMVSGLLLFLVFFISELFLHNTKITGISALSLFIVYSVRLVLWHTPGIWKKPLLWSLYIAILFINVSFLLVALSIYASVPKLLAIHALAYGGIGMITISMMARVSLGHTARNVNQPPEIMKYMFALLLLGTFFRVFFPMFLSGNYLLWIIASQICWILAFLLFVMTFMPILIRPRVDGQFG